MIFSKKVKTVSNVYFDVSIRSSKLLKRHLNVSETLRDTHWLYCLVLWKIGSVLKIIVQGLYHISALRSVWSIDNKHSNKLAFSRPVEAAYKILFQSD